MPLVTLDQFRKRVAADNQKLSPDDLGVDELTLQAALDAGKNDLYDTLMARGYMKSEVDAGDRLAEFHMSQSLYHAYFFMNVPNGFDLKQLEGFNRTKMVGNRDYGWRVNDAIIWPGNAASQDNAGGVCGTGQLGTADADVKSVEFRNEINNKWARW